MPSETTSSGHPHTDENDPGLVRLVDHHLLEQLGVPLTRLSLAALSGLSCAFSVYGGGGEVFGDFGDGLWAVRGFLCRVLPMMSWRVGVREHQRAIHQRVAGLLDRPRDEADLLAWAVLSALSSPSYHAVELPRARYERLMAEIGQVLSHTSRLRPAPAGEVRKSAGLARASRRETLLAAATTLFHERGYQAVGMEDIGAAAGIAGPSVYNHFGSKAEILITALNRANDGLQLALGQALTSSSGPREALEAVLRSYVDNTLAHSELNAMLVTEVMHLPGEQLRAMRRAQHDYILEWVGLLSAQRPELAQDEARVLVQSAMTLVNDLSLSTRARSRAHLAGELTGLSLDVPGLTEAAAGRVR